jgi:hypothetical protein
MTLPLLLALQAAAAPAPAPATSIPEIDFDLARYSQSELGLGRSACRRDATEIVVCAPHSRGDDPLEEMARLFEPGRLVAETRLMGNLVGGVRVERAVLGNGEVSNRILVGVRLPF